MPRRTASNASKKKPRKSPNVAPSYLGFSLQATRFLARLLEAQAGDVVCLEVFEDVGVEKKDGSRVAEQNKSNLATNPLSDRAVPFWKTFRNWADACRDGTLNADNTSFEIYTSNAASGLIVQSFCEAQDVATAGGALSNARRTLFGSDKQNAEPLAESLGPHVAAIFDPNDNVPSKIIARFRTRIGTGDPNAELKPLLTAKLVSEDAYDDVIQWAHGWVKQRIDRLIQNKKPAHISYTEFHASLLAYVRLHDRLDILKSVAGIPSSEQIKGELAFRVYIRQLRLVEVDDSDLLAAANDYLRSVVDRTEWAERGMIGPGLFDSFAEELSRTWKNKKDRTALLHADKTPIVQGKLLFLDCFAHEAQLDGLLTPAHFVRGSWHALADDQSIGWHADYATLLEATSDGSSE